VTATCQPDIHLGWLTDLSRARDELAHATSAREPV
jgi:hypothetical protein